VKSNPAGPARRPKGLNLEGRYATTGRVQLGPQLGCARNLLLGRIAAVRGGRLDLRGLRRCFLRVVLEALQGAEDDQHNHRHEYPGPDCLTALVGILRCGHRRFQGVCSHVWRSLRPAPTAGNSPAGRDSEDRRAVHKSLFISAFAAPAATVRYPTVTGRVNRRGPALPGLTNSTPSRRVIWGLWECPAMTT
jgi:hypothetical protein